MKLRHLRESIANTSGSGVGTSSGFTDKGGEGISGYDPPLNKRKKKQFEDIRKGITEWYLDDWEVQTTDGVISVRQNKPATLKKGQKIDNNFGHRNLPPENVERCNKCGRSSCKCSTSKKSENFIKKVEEDYTLSESGGKVIDSLQDIVSTGKTGTVSFNDGSNLKVDVTTAKAILAAREGLTPSNTTIMTNKLNSGRNSFEEVAKFSKNA